MELVEPTYEIPYGDLSIGSMFTVPNSCKVFHKIDNERSITTGSFGYSQYWFNPKYLVTIGDMVK